MASHCTSNAPGSHYTTSSRLLATHCFCQRRLFSSFVSCIVAIAELMENGSEITSLNFGKIGAKV